MKIDTKSKKTSQPFLNIFERFEKIKGSPLELPPRHLPPMTQARAEADRQAALDTASLFLPGVRNDVRAMPNHLARSSLYAPISRARLFHRELRLVSRVDAVIIYTGEQLDEADADLCMQLIFDAKPHPLGQPITLNRAALLRALGRNTGKSQYLWLHRRMKALSSATLFVEVIKQDGSTKFRIGDTEAFHILQSFRYNNAAQCYTFTLDPRWRALFGNREFARVDWEKRLRFGRNQDMAKALQRLIATSSDLVQRYALEWLKAKLVYGGRERDFRQALLRSVAELERLEIVRTGRIEESSRGRAQLSLWTE